MVVMVMTRIVMCVTVTVMCDVSRHRAATGSLVTVRRRSEV